MEYTKEAYTTAQKQAECIIDYHLQKLRESLLPVIEWLVVDADIARGVANDRQPTGDAPGDCAH